MLTNKGVAWDISQRHRRCFREITSLCGRLVPSRSWGGYDKNALHQGKAARKSGKALDNIDLSQIVSFSKITWRTT